VLYQHGAAAAAAGGISITPAMAVLQELAGTHDGAQLPVLLIWAFRHGCELELLCPPLLALAGALRLQLTPRLFYIGEHQTRVVTDRFHLVQ
jgi:ferredoxin-NADP reductase